MDDKKMRKAGFEPARLTPPPPQDGVSASSTTSARVKRNENRAGGKMQPNSQIVVPSIRTFKLLNSL